MGRLDYDDVFNYYIASRTRGFHKEHLNYLTTKHFSKDFADILTSSKYDSMYDPEDLYESSFDRWSRD